jgi:hypothetical protein
VRLEWRSEFERDFVERELEILRGALLWVRVVLTLSLLLQFVLVVRLESIALAVGFFLQCGALGSLLYLRDRIRR